MFENSIKNLVFEGGGVKGIAYGGALDELYQNGYLNDVVRVAGTSAGAISATLYALGCSPNEIAKIISQTNFKEFEDKTWLPLNVSGLFRKYGWFKGDTFKKWIGEKIKEKTGNPDFTFGDLANAIETENADFKHLYVVATNLTKQRPVTFSAESHPEMKIKDAVRMSMSIPLFFRSVKYKGDIYVDGGVAYNYPIDLFDHMKYIEHPELYDIAAEANGYVYNPETLGFRLDTREEIKYNKKGWVAMPISVAGIKTYAEGLVSFMMAMANKSHLAHEDWQRTIFIDTFDVQATDFDLNQEKIRDLVYSGKACVKEYFNWKQLSREDNDKEIIA